MTVSHACQQAISRSLKNVQDFAKRNDFFGLESRVVADVEPEEVDVVKEMENAKWKMAVAIRNWAE